MSAPRYARLAARLLARTDPSADSPPPSAEARAAAIAAIAGAIQAGARARRVRGWAMALSAVAAVFLASFTVSRHVARPGTPLASSPPPAAPAAPRRIEIVARTLGRDSGGYGPRLIDPWSVGAGGRVLVQPDARVALAFSTGTSAVLGEGSDITVVSVSSAQVLRLDAGSVDLHVAKLAGGDRFLVDTTDAEVEVRGTQFNVSIVDPEPWCGAGTVTRVVVTEGVVVVRRLGVEVRVGPGEQWPSGCVRPAAVAPSVVLPHATSAPTPSWAASSLAEQNALFARAVAARQRGDMQGALAVLDRLLEAYPGSPLEESAGVERLRVLRSLAPARAAAYAREYLARYPGGFARAEAEAILARTP